MSSPFVDPSAAHFRGATLKSLLDDFKSEAGLAVHWILMGSSGRKTRPEAGGVLRHYQQCSPNPRSFTKIIANLVFTRSVIPNNPHSVRFWCEGLRAATAGYNCNLTRLPGGLYCICMRRHVRHD